MRHPSPEPLHTIRLCDLIDLPAAPLSREWEIEDYDRECGGRPAVFVNNPEMRSLSLLATPCGLPGYLIATRVGPGEPTLVIFDEATGEAAGGIFYETLYVLADHRRKGIGSEILIRAFEVGIKNSDKDIGHTLSANARRARISAHRKAVKRAVSEGLFVDDEVLADYPEIKSQGIMVL